MEEVEVAEKESKSGMTSTFKVIKTACLVSTYIAMGLFLEITGPTLQDLKYRAHVDYEAVARAVAGRSAGDLFGSLIGGILVDKSGHHSDMIIGICLLSAASATISVPWAQQIEIIWMLVLIQGVSEVIVNVCANKVILEMWLAKASAPMHALHLGFGIGSFLIPLIANPFLGVRHKNVSNCTKNASVQVTQSSVFQNHTSGLDRSSNDDLIFITESKIEYAYLIAALPAVLFSVVFFVYQFKPSTKLSVVNKKKENVKKASFKEIINPATCASGDFCFGLTICILMFLQFFSVVGGERLMSKFIRAYSVDQIGFSKDDGSYVDTVFWVGFSAGRFAGFLVGKWIPIRAMLLIESSGIFLSTLLLATLGYIDPVIFLWICTGLIGFFTGPLFPTSMAWTDYHVTLTGMGITVNCLGGGVGGLVFLWVMGYFYEYTGPQTFPYEVLTFGTLTLGLSLTLHFVGKTKGSRFDPENKHN